MTRASFSGEQVSRKAVTNAEGKALFEAVPIGTFEVTETATPGGNGKVADWWEFVSGKVEVTAKYQSTMTYTVHNRCKEGGINVTKQIRFQGKQDSVNSNLAGFRFRLTGTTESGAKVDVTADTDQTGKVSFDNIPVGDQYTITEIASPDGKGGIADWWDASKAVLTSVKAEDGKTLSYVAVNTYKEGDVEVKKVIRSDAPSDAVNTNYAGFQFHLTGTSASGVAVDETAATNAEGIALFRSIPIGTGYTLTEIATPGAAAISDWWDPLNAVTTEIKANYKTKVTYSPVNYYESGNVVVKKQIELADPEQYNTESESKHHYNSSKAGFAFHLYGTSASKVSVDYFAVTDENGEAHFDHMPIGTYTVQEVRASAVPASAPCKSKATQELIQYVLPAAQTVTVKYDKQNHKELTSELTFQNILKKWSFSGTGKPNDTLIKQDYEAEAENVTQGEAVLEGAVYGLYDDGKLVATAKTNAAGRFDFTGWFVVGDGWYVQEITPSAGYTLDTRKYPVNACAQKYLTENKEKFQTKTINSIFLSNKDPKANTVTEQVIKQAVRIHKELVEGTIGTPLEGARFGIYLEKDLTAYAKATDFSGKLVSADDWTEFFRAVKNKEVKAGGKVISMTDISTALLYENDSSRLAGLTPTKVKNQYSVNWITTGKDGYAVSPELPYGKYVIYEAETPNTELDPAQAMFFIVKSDSRTPQTLNYSFLDFVADRYVDIVKIDGDSKKTVVKPNTQYLIYSCDKSGKYTDKDLVRQSYKNGNTTVVIGTKDHPWTTDKTGVITVVEELKAGTYAVREVNAPEGFHNPEKDVVFTVSNDQTYDYRPVYDHDEIIGYDEYLLVVYENPETRAQLTVIKTGETVESFGSRGILGAVTDALGLTDNKDFTYKTSEPDGAAYVVKAAEDIATQDGQGSYWYRKGETIATVVTGKTGSVTYTDKCSVCESGVTTYKSEISNKNCPFAAVSNSETGKVTLTLPLGSYTVTEVHAPYGYVLNDKPQTVTFKWNNQKEEMVKSELTFDNARTRTPPILPPDTPDTPDTPPGEEKPDTPDAPPSIEKPDILDVPPFTPPGTEEPDSQRGYVKLTKTDSLDGEPVEGAAFGLYNSTPIYDRSGKELLKADSLISTVATDKNGVATVKTDLPLMDEGYTAGSQKNSGDYYFVELKAAPYYELDATPQKVHVEYETQFILVVGARTSMTNKLSGHPDLKILKAVDKTEVQEIDCAEDKAELVYTLTVKNEGDGLAKKVVVSDDLPAEVSFRSSDPECSQRIGTSRCIWSLGKLAPGESREIRVKVKVSKTARSGDEIHNMAYVDYGNNIDDKGKPLPPIPSNEVVTKVVAPILTILKRQRINDGETTTEKLTGEAGDVITYFVDVGNASNATSAAFDVTVTDAVPKGLIYVKNSADNGGTYDAMTNTLTWKLGTLEIGGTKTVTFKALIPSTAYNTNYLNVGVVTASNAPKRESRVEEDTPDKQKITIHYVDTAGKPIADDFTAESKKDTPYDVVGKLYPSIKNGDSTYTKVGTGTFSTYAYRIIWNEICDVLIRSTRIGSHEVSLEMVSSSGTEPSLELSLEKLELEDLLSSAVKDAPLAVRKGLLALSLTAQGHKSHEIGQMLQVQSGTVRTWMSKARRFLREQPELEELAG